MMPFRKNSTTTMMITENTAMRKPFLNTAGAVMPRNVPASRPRSNHSDRKIYRKLASTEPVMEPMPPMTTISRIS